MADAASKDPAGAARTREFAFGDEDFAALRRLVKQLTGINLSEQKRELVYGRLSRRLRALGLSSFRDYRQMLESDADELVQFCNAITTNLTAFFREEHHFDYLREEFFKKLAADPRAPRRVRIWSAGCSSGEEPYSIAMTVRESLPSLAGWDIRILATDLDSDILARAKAGMYHPDRVRGLSPARLSRFFTEQGSAAARTYKVAPEVAALITFKQLNLMEPLPMRGPLDAIFCRNVIIYFDKETQRDLFRRMCALQRVGDRLFLGHSESLFKVSDDYQLIGRTIYRRN